MFCSNCGTELPDDAKFCASCGTPVNLNPNEPTPQRQASPPHPTSPSQTAAVIGTTTKAKPTWKKVVTWAFLFIVGIIALATITTSGLMDPVEAHLTALRSGDVETAYLQTSQAFRTSTPLPAFQKFVAAYPALTRHTNFSMDERGFEGNEGRVRGHLFMDSNKLAKIEFLMFKEDSGWKIQGMELKAPE